MVGMKYIASCSFGKDSLAMILKLMECKYPLDYVIFYDTGMEFKAIYNMRDKILPLLKENNIEYIELKMDESFEYYMFERKVNTRDKSDKYGYSWCGGNARWGTSMKLQAIEKFYKSHNDEIFVEYIGIAVDELNRLNRERQTNKVKLYPLVEWQMTEQDCLDYCYSNGYEWLEHDNISNKSYRLYDYLPRVSCWCCRNKNLDELRNYYHYMPMYWNKLKDIQGKVPNDPMKKQSGSVFDLEKRFELEDKWIRDGKGDKIRSKEFFKELKNKY